MATKASIQPAAERSMVRCRLMEGTPSSEAAGPEHLRVLPRRTVTTGVSRDNAHSDSSPETSALRGLRAVRILAEATRLLMSSCISPSGIVNQRPFGARGLSMRGETIRRDLHDGRPGTRPGHSAGPPRETSSHATPCRKTRYARRKTRTPRPCGQGVHSEPVGAPVSRAPLEVAGTGFEPVTSGL